MDIDPHTLQQILQRIYQQMRCPQCGKKVPVDFASVRVVADSAMLLQLRCEACNAYIVLQASLQGIEKLSAPPYEEETANASTTLDLSDEDLASIRASLQSSNGSFDDLFGDIEAEDELLSDEETEDDEDDEEDDSKTMSNDGPTIV